MGVRYKGYDRTWKVALMGGRRMKTSDLKKFLVLVAMLMPVILVSSVISGDMSVFKALLLYISGLHLISRYDVNSDYIRNTSKAIAFLFTRYIIPYCILLFIAASYDVKILLFILHFPQK